MSFHTGLGMDQQPPMQPGQPVQGPPQQLHPIVPVRQVENGGNNGSGSGNNSAGPAGSVRPPSNEFVRKLYNILEGNQYSDIVRWTEGGDSFVVLDTGKFTTQILPNHFKHSNFASFVRQLNKYDFHKIKKKPSEGQRSQNGELSWEFKHPFFRIHDEAALDHIKRKLSSSKRLQAEAQSNGMGGLLGSSANSSGMIAGKSSTDLSGDMYGAAGSMAQGMGHGVSREQLLSHTVSKDTFTTLRKRVDTLEKQLDICKNEVFIGKVENQKLNSKYNTVVESLITFKAVNENLINNFNVLCSAITSSGIKLPAGLYEPPSNPAHAIKNEEPLLTSPQHQQQQLDHNPVNMPLGPDDATADLAKISTANILSSTNILLGNQLEDGLVGMPLERPANSSGSGSRSGGNSGNSGNNALRKGFHVLLVEDDAISIKLCSKFLRKYGCTVEVVTDGLSAISTLEKQRFDLVLMDIVMPNLDGATATSIIRNFDNQTPIIAMTGNIDDQDLIAYLQHGMNDILAKPFTRDDLYTMLVRYLRNRVPLSEHERMQVPQHTPSIPQSASNDHTSTQSPEVPQNGTVPGPSALPMGLDEHQHPMHRNPHNLLHEPPFLDDVPNSADHIGKKPRL